MQGGRAVLHERGSKGLSVVDSPCGDDVDGLAIERGLSSLAQGHDFGDKDGRWDTEDEMNKHKRERAYVPVCPPPSPPWAQMISTPASKAFLTCFGCPIISTHQTLSGGRYTHDGNVCLVQTLDDVPGGNTDGGDEQRSTALNDDVNKSIKMAVRIIVIRLARVATDLRDEQIDAKRSLLVLEPLLQLVDLFLEHLGRTSAVLTSSRK